MIRKFLAVLLLVPVFVSPFKLLTAACSIDPAESWALEDVSVGFYATSGQGASSYDWSFGDGTYGNGSFVTHLWTDPGNYTIILTTTTSQGSEICTAAVKILPASDQATGPYFQVSDQLGDYVDVYAIHSIDIDERRGLDGGSDIEEVYFGYFEGMKSMNCTINPPAIPNNLTGVFVSSAKKHATAESIIPGSYTDVIGTAWADECCEPGECGACVVDKAVMSAIKQGDTGPNGVSIVTTQGNQVNRDWAYRVDRTFPGGMRVDQYCAARLLCENLSEIWSVQDYGVWTPCGSVSVDWAGASARQPHTNEVITLYVREYKIGGVPTNSMLTALTPAPGSTSPKNVEQQGTVLDLAPSGYSLEPHDVVYTPHIVSRTNYSENFIPVASFSGTLNGVDRITYLSTIASNNSQAWTITVPATGTTKLASSATKYFDPVSQNHYPVSCLAWIQNGKVTVKLYAHKPNDYPIAISSAYEVSQTITPSLYDLDWDIAGDPLGRIWIIWRGSGIEARFITHDNSGIVTMTPNTSLSSIRIAPSYYQFPRIIAAAEPAQNPRIWFSVVEGPPASQLRTRYFQTLASPPTNDERANAKVISCGYSETGAITTYATPSMTPAEGECWGANPMVDQQDVWFNLPVRDVWYKLIIPNGPDPYITITFNDDPYYNVTPGGGNYVGFIEFWRSDGTVAWDSRCGRWSEQFTLPIEGGGGEVYYIRLGSQSPSPNQSFSVSCFNKM